MAVDASKVLVGTPDQLTTGAILCAPLGTTLPDLDDITPKQVTLDEAFVDAGYANEDGAVVRNLLDEFNGTITFTLIQTDEAALKMAFGDGYVTASAATSEHGNQLKARIGARLPDAKSWVFKMKDGRARMLIVVPNGQVTSVDEVTFNATDPIGWAVTISCYPGADGDSIIILTDDGQTVAA